MLKPPEEASTTLRGTFPVFFTVRATFSSAVISLLSAVSKRAGALFIVITGTFILAI